MRRLSAAIAALTLTLGGVLLAAPSATADNEGTPPVVSYSFAPAEVTVDAAPGVGSTFVVTSLHRGTDGHSSLADVCPEPSSGHWSEFFTDGISGPVHCTFSSLDPGAWGILTLQGADHWNPRSDLRVDDYVVVPPAPAFETARLAHDGSVAFTGLGVAGDRILVHVGEDVVCDAAVDEAGAWACSAAGPFDAATEFVAVDENVRPDGLQRWNHVPGGLSAPSGVAQLVPPPPPDPTPPDPTPLLDPNWTFTLAGIDLTNIRPGATFAISAAGLPSGLEVTVELHSEPVTLATTTVGDDRTFSTQVTIPLSTPPGQHRIVVTLSGAGISPTSKEALVTIASLAPGSVPSGAPPPAVAQERPIVADRVASVSPAVVGSPPVTAPQPLRKAHESAESESGFELEHGAHAEEPEPGVEPNILTEALQPIQHVIANPAVVGSAFSIGLVLIILAVAPAHLLNATIAEQYDRFSGRFASFKPPRWYTALAAWMARNSAIAALLVIMVSAVLFGFADPHFGFNDHSLRLIVACTIALFFVAFVSSWVTGLILKQRWSVATMISIRPLGLVLTVLGVIASRLIGFSPGFLIGLVLGLSMATSAIPQFAWRAVAIRAWIIIGFGIAAWIGYSALTLHGEPHDFLGALIVETLVAITTEGIVMLLVVMLPFRLLEGEQVYAHSKGLWGAIYAVVTVVFVVAVVAWEGNWRELGGALWLWLSVVVAFGLACVAIYLYFRFWAPPLPQEVPDEEEPLARME